MYPFEHYGPDGKLYLHQDNWKYFREGLESQYPHNSNHRRWLLVIGNPSKNSREVCEDDASGLFAPENYSVVFGIYPGCIDGIHSLRFFAEDGHENPLGERLTLYRGTVKRYRKGTWNHVYGQPAVVYFQNQYWQVLEAEGGHLGPVPPPSLKKSTCAWRSIDDE